MALTGFQRRVCRLLAHSRKSRGDSYVAGAAALNEVIQAPRLSDDLDLFHDSDEALLVTWDRDRRLLLGEGFHLEILRDRPAFIEAVVGSGEARLRLQWARDSAYRFFPLVEHEDFGLTLHPYDLATNKVLAMVGRLEARDWVDVISAHERVQHLGLLLWGACGKDPGFGPGAILNHARRSARYTRDELSELSFEGNPPDAALLARKWRAAADEAELVMDALPAERAGTCVLDHGLRLFRGTLKELRRAVAAGGLCYHRGRIQGAYPRVLPE